MGWQAHTNVSEEQHRHEFELAAKHVKELTYSVDRLLERGGLESVDCCKMIETAANINACTNELLHAGVLSKMCNWHFPYNDEDYWAYLSARTFIEVAAKLHLVITFSW